MSSGHCAAQLPDLRALPTPWFAFASFAALAVVQIGIFWPRHYFEFTGDRMLDRMSRVGSDALPATIGPWRFVDF